MPTHTLTRGPRSVQTRVPHASSFSDRELSILRLLKNHGRRNIRYVAIGVFVIREEHLCGGHITSVANTARELAGLGLLLYDPQPGKSGDSSLCITHKGRELLGDEPLRDCLSSRQHVWVTRRLEGVGIITEMVCANCNFIVKGAQECKRYLSR